MKFRTVNYQVPAQPTSDGAGVKILRTLGQKQQVRLDPFLMLDQFSSCNAEDYIAGFPSHPHRGFQTVTYMLDGHMLHADSLGNEGHLHSGDVQWMRAGRGIIHSEMPQQTEGRMRGFQLWINLPATEKMQPPDWRDISSKEMPWQKIGDTASIKMVAGELSVLTGSGTDISVAGPISGLSMEPIMADILLQPAGSLRLQLPVNHNAFVLLYEGEVSIGDTQIQTNHAAILSEGDSLELGTTQFNSPARLLLLSGKPIKEPIAQYGPFVMNTREEIEQALADYRNGTLAQ